MAPQGAAANLFGSLHLSAIEATKRRNGATGGELPTDRAVEFANSPARTGNPVRPAGLERTEDMGVKTSLEAGGGLLIDICG